MILVGVRADPAGRHLPWYLFAVGQFGFVLGDGIRAVYESGLGVEAPFPSVADATYLAAYPILAVGVLLLVRQRDKDQANVIDAMILRDQRGGDPVDLPDGALYRDRAYRCSRS